MEYHNKEAQIILALQALEQDKNFSIRQASSIYNVASTTLRRRVHGITSRRDTNANCRILSNSEEEIIVQYILDLDSQGFSPRLREVADMANLLLRERGATAVGRNWAQRFVARQPALDTRWTRKYDSARALCEDPELISKWFDLMRNTIAKYGIVPTDTWNFDETGFLMGQISNCVVVTGSQRRSKVFRKQPGNREWSTVVQGISSEGVAIPPMVILQGKYHLSSWYENDDIPRDWILATSQNGWITNDLALDWVKHFHRSTVASRTGRYRLLILDGHESHHSAAFEMFCKDNDIITLCMPPHSSHLLQPLDVGCFSPLKRLYGDEIAKLMRARVTHIAKEDFLRCFYAVYNRVFSKANIQGAFRGAGLIPLDPQAVISKLDLRPETPILSTPSVRSDPSPTLRTPSNTNEVASQSRNIKSRIARHRSSSPTEILNAVDRVARGMTQVIARYTLLRSEVAELRKANQELSKRRRAKKTRLREGGSLSLQEGQALHDGNTIAQQLEGDMTSRRRRREGDAAAPRHCSNCGATGHNMRTCQVDVEMDEEEDSE
jgi:hypothetical protein